jgi:hypothetical protein
MRSCSSCADCHSADTCAIGRTINGGAIWGMILPEYERPKAWLTQTKVR